MNLDYFKGRADITEQLGATFFQIVQRDFPVGLIGKQIIKYIVVQRADGTEVLALLDGYNFEISHRDFDMAIQTPFNGNQPQVILAAGDFTFEHGRIYIEADQRTTISDSLQTRYTPDRYNHKDNQNHTIFLNALEQKIPAYTPMFQEV